MIGQWPVGPVAEIFTPGLIVYTITRCRVPLINQNLDVRQGRVNVFKIAT